MNAGAALTGAPFAAVVGVGKGMLKGAKSAATLRPNGQIAYDVGGLRKPRVLQGAGLKHYPGERFMRIGEVAGKAVGGLGKSSKSDLKPENISVLSG